MGKHHCMLHLLRVHKKVNHPFEVVYSNIWIFASVSSTLGFKYFIIFVDSFSHLTGYI